MILRVIQAARLKVEVRYYKFTVNPCGRLLATGYIQVIGVVRGRHSIKGCCLTESLLLTGTGDDIA